MPSSLLTLAPKVCDQVAAVHRELGRPITVLDVGPGFGKYGLLLREYVEGLDRGGVFERLDAQEAEPRYIERFTWLDSIYDHVFVGDVCAHADIDVGVPYDLVMMLDVLEHIERDEALHLLGRCRGRVLISTPRDYFQNPDVDVWPTENHRSHWTPEDFAALDRSCAPMIDNDAFERYACVMVMLGPQ